ncbi:MAG: DUF5337 family protein [Pseudomonadota bacterium]
MSKRDRPSISDKTRRLADKARMAALVIGFAFAGWMLAQVLGARLGWPVQLVFVFDLLGFLGLSCGLVLTYQVYRARKAAAADRPQAKVVGKSNKARTRRR